MLIGGTPTGTGARRLRRRAPAVAGGDRSGHDADQARRAEDGGARPRAALVIALGMGLVALGIAVGGRGLERARGPEPRCVPRVPGAVPARRVGRPGRRRGDRRSRAG